jgi:hypothetical protein
MPRKHCSKRKHTPITSKAQRGLFGAELRRRRSGRSVSIPSLKTKDIVSHLKESKGKNLPARARLRKALKRNKK